VRQAIVKTADDRLAVVWPELVKDGNCTPEQLESVITRIIKNHGQPYARVFKKLVKEPKEDYDELFA
jgi:hypothetical protein